MAEPVTMLRGSWPEWTGNWGLWFVYVRIRHGQCFIGGGRSIADAREKSVLVKESVDLQGVTDIEDAIRELKAVGYHVKSIVIPEHVEELA